MKHKNILITGCAGFIGYHVSNHLSNNSYKVFGVDNINSYYDINLKKTRLSILKKNKNFKFTKIDILDKKKLSFIIKNNNIDYILHLAAQAGVRYSVKSPDIYFKNNLEGFFNILELSRIHKVKHLVYASTSSVYGDQIKFPTKEDSDTSRPLSFYAATKKCNEVMAFSYSNIYKIPTTAIRFFTVYGPYGRPDMSLFTFCKSIIENKLINLFNNGDHTRDFTYIEDLLNPIQKIVHKIPKNKNIPFEVYNLGCSDPRKIKDYISIIEKELNLKANINKVPLQKGDVKITHADVNKFKKNITNYKSTKIETGIKNFIVWYKSFYK